MQAMAVQDERRRHKRFKVKKQTSFIVNPDWPDMGELVDISEGGFAFTYVADRKWKVGVEAQAMLFGDHDSCLKDIPMSTVADCVIDAGNGDTLIVRRRSVRFGKLDSRQKFLLDCFLWINAAAEC